MVKLKKELIMKWEKGTCVSDPAAQCGMAKSTTSTILKNREAIKAADVAKGVKSLTSKKLPAVEEVEKLLMVWINEKQLAGHSVSEAIICEKAKLLYSDIMRDTPGSSAEEFKASKGWFDNFKREQEFTVWLGMEKLPVQIKMLLKNLWRSLKTLWIKRDLFPNKYSIVTRQASSGKKC